MADHVIEYATPRVALIDRYSLAVLLSLAFAFGILGQYLFYRTALGLNVGIATVAVLMVASRLRPEGARTDLLDRWILPAAIVFAFLPAVRVDLLGAGLLVLTAAAMFPDPAIFARVLGCM